MEDIKNTTTVQAVLPDDLADELLRVAREEDRPLSNLIRRIVQRWSDERKAA